MIAKFGSFENALAERYRFEEELGRGAMGTVYRATDVRLGRPVAIKLLHPMLTNELGAARFQSEIRIAAGLHHPNIVGVHDSGEADGRLFYVMDYLGGETLRARLKREKQLSMEDALAIVDQVALGLQHAHDHGIVHRDVKPENIILAQGQASVLDFGLARALSDVDTDRLTASGLAVGTPHYLSPEQASAEKDVGPKADQYALACVLYEMLVGEPPFTGPTASAIAMRHITETAAPLRLRRKAASVAVEAAVMRAMEKVPGDRFPRVADFIVGLRQEVGSRKAFRIKPSRAIASGVITLALIVLGIALTQSSSGAREFAPINSALRTMTGRGLDTTRYVVLPLRAPASMDASAFDGSLARALARWTDVSSPSSSELLDAMSSRGVAALTNRSSAEVARQLRAGRYIVGDVSVAGDLLRIQAEVHDATGEMPTRSASVLTPTSGVSDSLFDHLAFELLFGREATRFESAARGTRNRIAFSAYLRGERALSNWNLPGADTAISLSLAADPAFPQARLALALVRTWRGASAAEVRSLLVQTFARKEVLSASDALHARALDDLHAQRYVRACAAYEDLIRRDSLDFAAWYGSAECNRRDNAVTRRADGVLVFGGSLNHAISAIDHAFDLLPQVHECCVGRMIDILRPYHQFTSGAKIRYGQATKAGVATFGAYPQIVDDTLAFVPRRTPLGARPPSNDVAVRRQQKLLLMIATTHLALAPQNPNALAFVGDALEASGDAAAIDSTRKARLRAANPSQALQLAVRELWLRVKYAVPNNLTQLRSARLFADSLLRYAEVRSAADAAALAGVAALVGDASQAAALAARGTVAGEAPDGIPQQVSAAGNALLAYAAVGGPVDSIAALDARLRNWIVGSVVVEQQPAAREIYLSRAIALAYPSYKNANWDDLDTASDVLLGAEAAHSRGDMSRVRRLIASIDRTRMHMSPSAITLDALFPEAWLLASIGDSTAALARLNRTLDALQSVPVRSFDDAINAGALVQSMRLRAQLQSAGTAGSSKTRWSAAVQVLSTPAASRR